MCDAMVQASLLEYEEAPEIGFLTLVRKPREARFHSPFHSANRKPWLDAFWFFVIIKKSVFPSSKLQGGFNFLLEQA
jgi:hypothetical protein